MFIAYSTASCNTLATSKISKYEAIGIALASHQNASADFLVVIESDNIRQEPPPGHIVWRGQCATGFRRTENEK